MTQLSNISTNVSDAHSVKIHRSLAEIETLRSYWTAAQQHPNSDIDHFLLVCRLRPEVVSPCVLSLWLSGQCHGVVAGRIEHVAIRPEVGYLKMPHVHTKVFTLIHEGIIGKFGPHEAELIVEAISQIIVNRFADLASFSCLREDSPLLPILRSMRQRVTGVSRPRWYEHRDLTMPAQPGFLIQAMRSKHRSWTKKKARDLENAYEGKIAWHWHTRIDDVAPLCEIMEQVAAKTYQRGLDAGFKNDQEHRERFSLFAKQGNLRVMILETNQQPAAFWVGESYKGTFHSEATGYIVELGVHEVGTQIFLRLVDELVKEGTTKFDFGLGDAQYKQRFGDRSWRETTVKLFGAGWKSLVLRNYLTIFELIDQTLRTMVKKLGILDRIKQVWRRRLAHNNNRSETTPKPSSGD